MHVIEGRNVNTVYPQLVRLLRAEGQRGESRAGEVLTLPSPVITVVHRPTERVLFDKNRRANPFFHFFESLRMLAGRRDYTWLDRFVADFSARFGESDGNGHGAYGHRWRHHFGYDQLDNVVSKLQRDPSDRRVVIQMWDGAYNTMYGIGANDLRGDKHDIPCNTHIYPRIVDGALDLTVCCRSNDIIWGMMGANVVHFSFLLEHLANQIGVAVGKLYQLANNCHAYVRVLDRVGEPVARDRWEADLYGRGDVESMQIDLEDEDLLLFMHYSEDESSAWIPPNDWWMHVVAPMWDAHRLFKEGDMEGALAQAYDIGATDWRLACLNWLHDRRKK